MTTRPFSFTLLLAGTLLVAPPTPVPAPPPHTGVQGGVTWVSSPVHIQLPDGTWVGLPQRVLPADTTISLYKSRTGRMVNRVATQAGHFSVSLPPGNYTLLPDPWPSTSGDPPLVNTEEVTVHPRQFTAVSFAYYYLPRFVQFSNPRP